MVIYWLLLATHANVAAAGCDPGDVLVDEDERYWYCSTPEPTENAAAAIDTINQHLLGPEWRYRKAVIDTVGSLARPPGDKYTFGGKLRIESGGRVTWMCVSQKCAGDVGGGIDCSGLVEFGAAHAACFVRGISSLSGLNVRNMIGSAAEQAAYFRSQGALKDADATPNPGDFIFFKHTTKQSGENQITHVGIYLGREDDDILIIHASSRAGRVIFDRLEPDGLLTQKIAGYGDISILTPNR